MKLFVSFGRIYYGQCNKLEQGFLADLSVELSVELYGRAGKPRGKRGGGKWM